MTVTGWPSTGQSGGKWFLFGARALSGQRLERNTARGSAKRRDYWERLLRGESATTFLFTRKAWENQVHRRKHSLLLQWRET